jgi:D-alanyl-D-alanine carboxypeptidase
VLGHADPFTEKVVKGAKELYRARFAGFDRDSAEAACHHFKRNDIACISLKN